MASTLKSIEHTMEKHKSKGKYLDESSSIQISNELRNNILQSASSVHSHHGHDQHKDFYKPVFLLNSVLQTSKPSDLFGKILDGALVSSLLSFVTKSTSSDTIAAIYSIISTILKGQLFLNLDPAQYTIGVLEAIHNHLSLAHVLGSKLYTENIELITTSLEFINIYILLNHYQLKSVDYLLEFWSALVSSDFFPILSNIAQDQRFKTLLAKQMSQLDSSMVQMWRILNQLGVETSSKVQVKFLNDITEKLSKLDRTRDKQFMIDNYSVLQLLDLYVFLQSSNISFRKTFNEQLLFNLDRSKNFPLIQISYRITNLLLSVFTRETENRADYQNLEKFIYLKDLFHYKVISKFLEIWTVSQAEQEDLSTLYPLIELLLKLLNNEIDSSGSNTLDKILQIFKTMTYEELRQVQLKDIRNHIMEQAKEQSSSFDQMLKEQVFEFVKSQRFLQLSKGSWVYAELPSSHSSSLVRDSEHSSSSAYYFIILSPNLKNLLYKEYKFKTSNTPNIDKTGVPIDITSISSFKIEELSKVDTKSDEYPADSNRLINLIDKTIINKITLLDRKNKTLFCFFAKKDDSLIWLDGLNLLLGNYQVLSEDLNSQLRKLFQIRKTVQLLNYSKIDELLLYSKDPMNAQVVPTEDDAELYDLNTLEALATDFYYT